MLIITQSWYEGKRRLLIVVPTPLLHQWENIINNSFSIPLFSIDNNIIFNEQITAGNENPFVQDGIVLTTYTFAAEKSDYLADVDWHMTIFDEAHRLRNIHKEKNTGGIDD